ncbi:methylaspartate ammonia-lyase [Glutamicibacter arilaitensis]|uniref:methylaspartate ammonia-lyase n=1 Tax=Glutamicibacter arilaitensis TaxID=256701 RepID=UPI0038507867
MTSTSQSPRKIVDVIASTGFGGFFFDDQAAIKAGSRRDGATYEGTTLTPGYKSVREPAESVSVMLVLDDGYIATGDCASVQYSGVGGREPRFHKTELAETIETQLGPLLYGLEVDTFRTAAEKAESAVNGIDGLGRAAAYGVSQALLDAASHAAGHHLMARIISEEWNLHGDLSVIPVYAQTGEDRYDNVDKMILKSVPVIPHGLINTLELVGPDGSVLESYVSWIRERVQQLSVQSSYLPVIHLDVYGMIGVAAGGSIPGTAEILQRLQKAAAPHKLRIEHPIHAGTRDEQIQVMTSLRAELKVQGIDVEIIADEWANTAEDIHLFAAAGAADLVQIKTPDLGSIHHTVDAILDCQAHGIGTVLGGTCAETDRSARTTAHIGIATGVTQMLAKPGMGVDEGLMIVNNEMNRALRVDKRLKDIEKSS